MKRQGGYLLSVGIISLVIPLRSTTLLGQAPTLPTPQGLHIAVVGLISGLNGAGRQPVFLEGIKFSSNNHRVAIGGAFEVGTPKVGIFGLDVVPGSQKLDSSGDSPVQISATLKRLEIKVSWKQEVEFKPKWMPKLIMGGGGLSRREELTGVFRYTNPVTQSTFEIPVSARNRSFLNRLGLLGIVGHTFQIERFTVPFEAHYALLSGCDLLKNLEALQDFQNRCWSHELQAKLTVRLPQFTKIFKIRLGTLFPIPDVK